MEILLNELSLTGQFVSAEQFINEGLPPFLAVLNEIDVSRDLLYKKYDFYSYHVTKNVSVYDVLAGSIFRQYDEIRKFKSKLAALFDNPYWEDNQRHSADCKYVYNGNCVSGQSLAEACERDQIVISVIHQDYSSVNLSVIKDRTNIQIDNLTRKGNYVEIAYGRNEMSCKEYCIKKFTNEKLNFSKLDEKEGFSLLKREDENIFIDGFRKFASLTWSQINVNDALDYKEYKDNMKHFKALNKKIHKFRISKKYRCFGYVEEGIFYILCFDLTHKLSDVG